MKVGDTVAVITYAKVKDVKTDRRGRPVLDVEDIDRGGTLSFAGQEFINTLFSADEFEDEEKLSRTDLALKLQSTGDKPFTVNFDKKDGSNRTLVGRLAGTENIFGRSDVVDLTKPADSHRIRQVDHRTLQWLIFDGVKYSLK